MKCLMRIFDLSKSEQRVVLIVMLILITVAFIGYQHRVHHRPVQVTSGTEPNPSSTPTENDR
jgi:hypothetical protein